MGEVAPDDAGVHGDLGAPGEDVPDLGPDAGGPPVEQGCLEITGADDGRELVFSLQPTAPLELELRFDGEAPPRPPNGGQRGVVTVRGEEDGLAPQVLRIEGPEGPAIWELEVVPGPHQIQHSSGTSGDNDAPYGLYATTEAELGDSERFVFDPQTASLALSLTVDGAPPPVVPGRSSRGRVFVRGPEAGLTRPLEVPPEGPARLEVLTFGSTVDIEWLTSSTCGASRPCGTATFEDLLVEDTTTVTFDAVSHRFSGRITIDGAPPSAVQRQELSLELIREGNTPVSALLDEEGRFDFRLLAGSYDVFIVGRRTDDEGVILGEQRLREDLVVDRDRSLEEDLDLVELEVSATVNGANVDELGPQQLVFRALGSYSTRSFTLPSQALRGGDVAVRTVIAGDYELIWDAGGPQCGTAWPCVSHRLDTVSVDGSQPLALDLVRRRFAIDLTLGGAAWPDAPNPETDRGFVQLLFQDEDPGLESSLDFPLGSTGPVRVEAPLTDGRVELLYQAPSPIEPCEAGELGPVPCQFIALVAELEVESDIDQTIDFSVPEIRGRLTVNGVPREEAAFGSLLLFDEQSVINLELDEGGAFVGRAPEGSYSVLYQPPEPCEVGTGLCAPQLVRACSSQN